MLARPLLLPLQPLLPPGTHLSDIPTRTSCLYFILYSCSRTMTRASLRVYPRYRTRALRRLGSTRSAGRCAWARTARWATSRTSSSAASASSSPSPSSTSQTAERLQSVRLKLRVGDVWETAHNRQSARFSSPAQVPLGAHGSLLAQVASSSRPSSSPTSSLYPSRSSPPAHSSNKDPLLSRP